MTSVARKILNELMGPDRHKPLGTQGHSAVRYTQPEVCKHFLVDFCPYEAFLNTKSDIGPCPCRVHDPLIKAEFEQRATPNQREAYSRPFNDLCWRLLDDLERKLRRNKERIDQPHASGAALTPENDELEAKRRTLERQVRDALARMESLGGQGKVGEAQEVMVQVDLLQNELERLKTCDLATSAAAVVDANNPLVRMERKMELCPTCGSFLIVNDTPARVQAHYQGRQHNGWVQLRAALERCKAQRASQARTHHSRDDVREGGSARERRHHERESLRDRRVDSRERDRSPPRSAHHSRDPHARDRAPHDKARDQYDRHHYERRREYSDRGGYDRGR
jgi:hypothetical protein